MGWAQAPYSGTSNHHLVTLREGLGRIRGALVAAATHSMTGSPRWRDGPSVGGGTPRGEGHPHRYVLRRQEVVESRGSGGLARPPPVAKCMCVRQELCGGAHL